MAKWDLGNRDVGQPPSAAPVRPRAAGPHFPTRVDRFGTNGPGLPKGRRGFSLVEVLVLLGIIAILCGILLPAVQMAREAGRRLRCANHLKQIVLALHSYDATWGGFPPSSQCGKPSGSRTGAWCFSVQSALLPYLEEGPLYHAVNFNLPGLRYADVSNPSNAGNGSVASVRVGAFLCPSDPNSSLAPGGCNSYRANKGVCAFCIEDDKGSFVYGKLGSLALFRDGTSNTIAFSEKPIASPAATDYSPFRDWVRYSNNPLPATGAQWAAACSSLEDSDGAEFDAGRSWLLPGGIYTWFYVSVPPNSPVPDCGARHAGGTGIFAARSYHPAGVNTGMVDGSVRWISSGIAPESWRALGTRDSGELGPSL